MDFPDHDFLTKTAVTNLLTPCKYHDICYLDKIF